MIDGGTFQVGLTVMNFIVSSAAASRESPAFRDDLVFQTGAPFCITLSV